MQLFYLFVAENKETNKNTKFTDIENRIVAARNG